jgi:hypothetical protein
LGLESDDDGSSAGEEAREVRLAADPCGEGELLGRHPMLARAGEIARTISLLG